MSRSALLMIVVGSASLLVLVGVIRWGGLGQTNLDAPARIASAQQGAPTPPSAADPIFTASEAITRALRVAPTGFTVLASTARLLDYQTLEMWRGAQGARSSPLAPVWLVGIQGAPVSVGAFMTGAGLLDADGLNITDPSGSPVNLGPDEILFTDFYYIFDANGGHRKGGGVLEDGSPQSYASLSSLTDMVIPIAPATPVPYISPQPETTPMETPPW